MRLGTSTQDRAELSPAAENHKNPIFPPGLPFYAHAELMEDVQFQHREAKNNFSFYFLLLCLHTQI